MSDQNNYEVLEVTEDATFDEIQDARSRLLQQYSGDHKHLDTIEAAYDAILMERLRMRKKVKLRFQKVSGLPSAFRNHLLNKALLLLNSRLLGYKIYVIRRVQQIFCCLVVYFWF